MNLTAMKSSILERLTNTLRLQKGRNAKTVLRCLTVIVAERIRGPASYMNVAIIRVGMDIALNVPELFILLMVQVFGYVDVTCLIQAAMIQMMQLNSPVKT